MSDKTRCEGWRRTGGAFTLGGRPVWAQCENDAVVTLEVKQEKVENMPACMECWAEAKDSGIEILSAEPLA